MKKKLVKHGNSLALVIDKSILELLKISEKTQLEIKIEGTRLIIEPVQSKKKEKRLLNKANTNLFADLHCDCKFNMMLRDSCPGDQNQKRSLADVIS